MSTESGMPAKLRFYLDCKREQFRRWCYQQILLYRNRDRARYFVLWEDPLVTCVGCHHDAGGPRHWRESCPFNIRCMEELSPARVAVAVSQLLPSSRVPA